jgi:hypothetical protein
MLNTIVGMLSGGAPGTDYESIATVTVGSGGASSIDFTSIPSTYTHLQIRGIIRTSSYAFQLLQFNSDTANNYAYHYLYGNGSITGAAGVSTTSSIGFTDSTSTANIFNGFVMDILDYKSTNKNKTTKSIGGLDANGSGIILLNSGLWFKTPEAITTIKITPSLGTYQQYSSFALYGIK